MEALFKSGLETKNDRGELGLEDYLDAVRRRNHNQMVAEINDALVLSTDDDLLAGAVALLTATVSLWARRTGQSPRRAAADLCLLASLESVA